MVINLGQTLLFSPIRNQAPYTYTRFCPSNLHSQDPLVPILLPFSSLSDIIKPLNQDCHATSNLNQTQFSTLENRASESHQRKMGRILPWYLM